MQKLCIIAHDEPGILENRAFIPVTIGCCRGGASLLESFQHSERYNKSDIKVRSTDITPIGGESVHAKNGPGRMRLVTGR